MMSSMVVNWLKSSTRGRRAPLAAGREAAPSRSPRVAPPRARQAARGSVARDQGASCRRPDAQRGTGASTLCALRHCVLLHVIDVLRWDGYVSPPTRKMEGGEELTCPLTRRCLRRPLPLLFLLLRVPRHFPHSPCVSARAASSRRPPLPLPSTCLPLGCSWLRQTHPPPPATHTRTPPLSTGS
jgi:hypothetical protein